MPDYSFKVGDDIYDIPGGEKDGFLKSNPNAIQVQSFVQDKDTFDIPLNEVKGFKVKFPDARLLGEEQVEKDDKAWYDKVGDAAESARLGLVKGVDHAIANTARLPEYLYDVAATVGNVAKLSPAVPDINFPSSKEIGEKTGIHNRLAEHWEARYKMIDEAQRKLNPELDEGIIDPLMEGKVGTAATNLITGLNESAPMMLAMIAAPHNALSYVGFAGAFGAGEERAMREDGAEDHMSEEAIMGASLLKGTAEMFFEQTMGAGQMGNVLRKIIQKEGKDAAKSTLVGKFNDWIVKQVIKNPKLALFGESVEEFFTQVAQNAVDKYSGYRPDVNLFEGGWDAAIQGAAMGGGFQAATHGAKYIARQEQKKKYLSNLDPNQQTKLKSILRSEDPNQISDALDVFTSGMNDNDKLGVYTYAGLNLRDKGIENINKIQQGQEAVTKIEQEVDAKIQQNQHNDGQRVVTITNKQGDLLFVNEGEVQQDPETGEVTSESAELVTVDMDGKKVMISPNDVESVQIQSPEEMKAEMMQRGLGTMGQGMQQQEQAQKTEDDLLIVPGQTFITPDGKEGSVDVDFEDGTWGVTIDGKAQPMPESQIIELISNQVDAEGQAVQEQIQLEKEKQQTEDNLEIPTKPIEIAKDKDGNVDYDALIEDPVLFIQEFGKEFGEEEAINELMAIVETSTKKIEQLEKKAEKSTSLNDRAKTRREITGLTGNITRINQLLNNGKVQPTESIEEVQTTDETADIVSPDTKSVEQGAEDRGDSDVELKVKGTLKQVKPLSVLEEELKELLARKERGSKDTGLDAQIEEWTAEIEKAKELGIDQGRVVGGEEVESKPDQETTSETSEQKQTEEQIINDVRAIFERNGQPLRSDRGKEYIINRFNSSSSPIFEGWSEEDIRAVVNYSYDLTQSEVTETKTPILTAEQAEKAGLSEREIPTKTTLRADEQTEQIPKEEITETVPVDETAGQEQVSDVAAVSSEEVESEQEAMKSINPALYTLAQKATTVEEFVELVAKSESKSVKDIETKDLREWYPRVEKKQEQTSSPEVIEEEKAKVDTNPSEAQKEAENYQKGHIKVQGMDITIENPRGSTRSGTAENGKKWSQEMANTYGYFKRTKGKDGDQIDVFLGYDVNSEKIFVVDQVNEDGSFDEHKVMMGFNHIDEARQDYLANYEEGWNGLGNITEVSLEEFKKWVGKRATRKSKPFAEYKAVKEAKKKELVEKNRKQTLQYKVTQIDPSTPDGIVLKHFALGGKINREALISLYGNAGLGTKENNSNIESERKARFSYVSDKLGKTVDQIAHDLWQDNPELGFETDAYIEAVEGAIQAYTHPAQMARELIETHEEDAKKEANQGFSDEQIAEMQQIEDNLNKEKENIYNELVINSIRELEEKGLLLTPELEAEIFGHIIEYTNEEKNARRTKEDSQEGSTTTDEEILPIRDRGIEDDSGRYKDQVEADIDKEISRLQDNLNTVQRERENKLAELQSRPGLFGDTKQEPKDPEFVSQLFEAEFEPTKDNFNEALKPIDERITKIEREIETLEKGKQSAIDEAGRQQQIEVEPKSISEAKTVQELQDMLAQGIVKKDKAFDERMEELRKPVEEKPKKETKDKIDDFGEKIEGAKKDTYKPIENVTNEDLTSQPLSKTFPKPDFAKLVKEGAMDEDAAMVMKFLYSEIPSKPRKKYRQRRWAETVQNAIDTYNSFLKDPGAGKVFIDALAKDKSYGSLATKFSNFSDIHKALGFPNENTTTGAYAIRKIRDKDGSFYYVTKGNIIVYKSPTVEGAATALKDILNKNKDKPKGVKLSIYKDTKTSKFFIGKKGAVGVVRLVEDIDTVKEASEILKSQQAQLQEMWDALRLKPKERRESNRVRIGTDYRNGKDITPDEFGDKFGFRGVQFGNWVNNRERQDALNDAYDAFMDLATVIEVDPESLSLNGELGIAFGARGSGDASAHYESGQVVINMTKTKGAGSLAHEWWHALDSYFSRTRGEKNNFLTQKPIQGWRTKDGKAVPDDRIRKEMADAFSDVVDAIRKSELPKRSESLDQTRSKKYWSDIIEMTARSFENFIIEKLGTTDAQNDYLANFKETSDWLSSDAFSMDNYPYPLKDETESINKAFDDFFETIEEKEEDGKKILFSLAEPIDVVETRAFKDWFGNSKVVDKDGKPLVVYHGTGTTITEFKPEFTGKGNDQLGSGFYFTTDIDEAEAYKTAVNIPGGIKPGGIEEPNIVEAYLSIQNPLEVKGSNLSDVDIDITPIQAFQLLSKSPKINDKEESPLGDWFDIWTEGIQPYMIEEVANEYTGKSLISLENDFFKGEEQQFRQAIKDVLGYDGVVYSLDNKKHFVAWFPNQIKSAINNTGAFSPLDNDIRFVFASKPADPESAGTRISDKYVETFNKWDNEARSQAKRIADSLGIKINVVSSEGEIPIKYDIDSTNAGGARRMGFFDPKSGEIYVILSNHENTDEVRKTILHEAVGHKGLRLLFGRKMNNLLSSIYSQMSEDQIKYFTEKYTTKDKKGNLIEPTIFTVAEEYLADKAQKGERIGFVRQALATIRQWIREVFGLKYSNNDLLNLFELSRKKLKEPTKPPTKPTKKTKPTFVGEIFTQDGTKTDSDQRPGDDSRQSVTDTKEAESTDIAYSFGDETKSPSEIVESIGKKYQDKRGRQRTTKEVIQGIREFYQDRDLPLRKFEEDIIKKGGVQTNKMKPYRDMTLSFGRMETLYREFTNDLMKPVIRSISDIINDGTKAENVLPYVIAKHGLERNEFMRSQELEEWIAKNPESTEEELQEIKDTLENKDYSGISAFNPEMNPDELANLIIKEFESSVDPKLLNNLWSKIKTATNYIVDTWEDGNTISSEQADLLKLRYNNFVPLRGWREGAAKSLIYKKGEGFSQSFKTAHGRTSLADNPLSYISQTAFKAIGEQVDNEVKTSLYKLMFKNYNDDTKDMYRIKKMYYQKVELPDGSIEWEPTLEMPSAEEFKNGDAKTIISRQHEKLRTPTEANEHEVIVKTKYGDVSLVLLNKYLPVAQVMNKQNSMYINLRGEVSDIAPLNKQLGIFPGAWNNIMKQLFTSWNVVFPFSNFNRDIPESMITSYLKGDIKDATRIIKHLPKAFKEIVSYMRGNKPKGLMQFMHTGGQTGFTHLKTPEQLEKEFNRELRLLTKSGILPNTRKAWDKVFRSIEDWNKLFEDAVRYSVYLSSLDAGKTKEDAAYDSKEASVNFNRKGKSSKSFDALYAFWNVALQSVQKNFKLAKDHPVKFSKVAAGITMLGMMEAFLNDIAPGDDDDDYYNINDYVRQNYAVIPNIYNLILGNKKGNRYLRIPLPQFWRGFHSAGVILYDVMKGKQNAKDATADATVNFIAGLSPIDVGGFVNDEGEFTIAPLMPTVIKPPIEAFVTNRNFMDNQISKEPFTKKLEQTLASSGLHKKNVNTAVKFLTDALFELGGGDIEKEKRSKYYVKDGKIFKISDLMDINPSKIEHLFTGYTGGTGRTIGDMIKTIGQMISDEEVDFKTIPFYNSFIKKTPEKKWSILREYYDLKDKIEGYDQVKKDGKPLNEYYNRYEQVIDRREKEIKEALKNIDWDSSSSADRVFVLMKGTIDDIENLDKQYN